MRKGITTDYLCSQHQHDSIVIRYSGGHQAGHTVARLNDDGTETRHVFSNFGSGSMQGVPTYWSKYCTVDPMAVENEYEVLKSKGIRPLLYIDERCPITTPYEMYKNRRGDEVQHGTCGVGVGATYEREANFYSLTFGDLFNDFVLKTKLSLIKKYYLHKMSIVPNMDYFINAVKFITTAKFIRRAFDCPSNWQTHIYEGSQGLMLDQHYGFFPHVTRSNVGTTNIVEMEGSVPEIYLVTRAYQTRHGNGPMSNEGNNLFIEDDPMETNVSHKFQGEFRKALLDVSLLEYAISKDAGIRKNLYTTTLVITCLDHLNKYVYSYNNELVVCNSKEKFCAAISSKLGIRKVIISESPYSKNYKVLH